jgi:hypothetical protein
MAVMVTRFQIEGLNSRSISYHFSILELSEDPVFVSVPGLRNLGPSILREISHLRKILILRFFPFSKDAVQTLYSSVNRYALGATLTEARQAKWVSGDVNLIWTAKDTYFFHPLYTQMLEDEGQRLAVANQELYQQFDRQQSEAELRDSLVVSLPLAFIAIVLNTNLGVATDLVGGALILLLLVLMFRQARTYDRKAWSVYAKAVADHVISTPLLDDVLAWSEPMPKPDEPRPIADHPDGSHDAPISTEATDDAPVPTEVADSSSDDRSDES